MATEDREEYKRLVAEAKEKQKDEISDRHMQHSVFHTTVYRVSCIFMSRIFSVPTELYNAS